MYHWNFGIGKKPTQPVEENSSESIERESFLGSQDFEEEEEEEEKENINDRAKRSDTHLPRSSSKRSISHLGRLHLAGPELTIDISLYRRKNPNLNNSDVTFNSTTPQSETEAMAFKHNETWTRIKQLAITSKHYTARDKNEILAQEPTFAAIDDFEQFAATCNDPAKKARYDHVVLNAKAQLKLYYLVGTEGWGTALATIKSEEAVRLGIPEPKHVTKPQIIYVNQQRYQSNNTYNASKKSYGRRAYFVKSKVYKLE